MAAHVGETVNYGDVLISKFRPVDDEMMDDESYVYDFNYEKDYS